MLAIACEITLLQVNDVMFVLQLQHKLMKIKNQESRLCPNQRVMVNIDTLFGVQTSDVASWSNDATTALARVTATCSTNFPV